MSTKEATNARNMGFYVPKGVKAALDKAQGDGYTRVYTKTDIPQLSGGIGQTIGNDEVFAHIPANARCIERRTDAVSMAILSFIRRDGTEANGVSTKLKDVLEDIQDLLSDIEEHCIKQGVAFLYYNGTNIKLVPKGKVVGSFLMKDGEYGQYTDVANNINVALNSTNTIRVGINGVLPPQTVALAPCMEMSNIMSARSAEYEKAIVGLNMVLALEGGTPEQTDEFVTSLLETYGGIDNIKHLLPVKVPENTKLTPITVRPRDTEVPYLETYIQAILDVARAYGVPPVLIYYMEQSTYNNVREAKKDFYDSTVEPRWRRICRDLTKGMRTVIGLAISNDLKVSYDYNHVRGLNPGIEEILPNIDRGVGAPVLTRNEARGLIGFPDREDGDVIVDQYNTTTFSFNEPVELTSTDQKNMVARITKYAADGVEPEAIVNNELYKLNLLYDKFLTKSELRRTQRFLDAGMYDEKSGAKKLVRFVHVDFYTALGFKDFKYISHKSGDLCGDPDCILADGAVGHLNEKILDGCKCLITPTATKQMTATKLEKK